MKRWDELHKRLGKVGWSRLHDPVAKKEYERLQSIGQDYIEGKRDSLD